MTKEELIRDNDYTEEEAEKMVLQNKLDKANKRIEELEDMRKEVLNFIEVGFNQQTVGYSNYINIKQLLKEE